MSIDNLKTIGEQIRIQDNQCTANPMFCVQRLIADSGYDWRYADSNQCWWNPEECEWLYDTPPEDWDDDRRGEEQNGWEMFGYQTRWETVMVAFTKKGCEEYLNENGHNDRRVAHNGEVRIYVESFNRCPEMIGVREFLRSL